MADKEEVSLDDIAYIINAFGISQLKTDRLEKFVLRNFLRLTPKQSAQIMIQAGHWIEEPEIVEICEKVLASNISEITAERGGQTLLFQAWKGFLSSTHSREKIILLLQSKIVQDF